MKARRRRGPGHIAHPLRISGVEQLGQSTTASRVVTPPRERFRSNRMTRTCSSRCSRERNGIQMRSEEASRRRCSSCSPQLVGLGFIVGVVDRAAILGEEGEKRLLERVGDLVLELGV